MFCSDLGYFIVFIVMQNTENNNIIQAAKDKLEETLMYFMDVAEAFEASDGLLARWRCTTTS